MKEIVDYNRDQQIPDEQVNKLVPIWIKLFGALYMFVTIVYLLYHIPGLFSSRYFYGYLGLNTLPYSGEGIATLVLLLFGSVVAFALITGWKYAIDLAFGHAILQLGVAFAVFLAGRGLTLYLLLLIPYTLYIRFLHLRKEKILEEYNNVPEVDGRR